MQREDDQYFVSAEVGSASIMQVSQFSDSFFGEVRSIINVYSLFLSSLSMPGLELVHCKKAELAAHFNSETYLQHAFDKCVKPKNVR